MNRKKIFLHLLFFIFAMAFVLTGRIPVQAAKRQTASITLNKSVYTLQRGKSVKLKAIIRKAGKKKKVEWSSSNQKVASVSPNGKVTAKKNGRAKITARIKGTKVKATCRIIVETPTAKPEEPSKQGNLLVAYFSWSGTSERIAQNIIAQTGADSFRIERETPYSDDYNTVAYGEAKDEADTNARPPIKNPLPSIAQYDKILLCYPIWWHTAPMTVGTFLESYDLSGKHIYPISQSASMSTSQYDQSVAFIKECAKGAVVDNGIFSKDNAAILAYVKETVM